MANVTEVVADEVLIPLNCGVSEKQVQDADKALALHKATRKDRKPRLTLAALAVKVKRKRDEELPFGKFAKDHRLTAVGSGRERTIAGENGFIFLHPDYSYALQYQGTRSDVYAVKALIDAGAILIETDRLAPYREIRYRDEEVIDDDGQARVEGQFGYEFRYTVAEGERNLLTEALKAPLSLVLAFDATNAVQVQAVLKLAKIGKHQTTQLQKVAA
jgi:hypothetical protein